MYGFKPQHARGKPVQNFADGGIVHSIKGALGLRPRTSEELLAADAKRMEQNREAAAAIAERNRKAQPAPKQQSAISEYSGMSAMQRREKELGLKDGGRVEPRGFVSGKGTGTSDSIKARLSNGEYVLPADTVKAVGVEALDALRAATHTPVKHEQAKAARGFFAGGTPGGVDEEKRQNSFGDAAAVARDSSVAQVGGLANNGGADASRFAKVPAPIGTQPGRTPEPAAQPAAPVPTAASTQSAGQPLDAQAASDRAKLGAAWDTVKDVNDSAGRAIADAAMLAPRAVAGAYDSAVVRPMRAAGFNAGYLSPILVPNGVDPSSMTPYADQKRMQEQVGAVAPSAPAATSSVAATASTAGAGRGVVNPPLAKPSAPAPTNAPAAATGSGEVTRVGNSYSGTNVSGDISINGQAPRNGGQVSAQNMAAADALSARSQQESMARVTAQPAVGFQPAGVTAPTVRHSGNDWQARNDLRNAQVSASSITQSDKWGKGGDRTATAQYLALQGADAAARGQQPAMDQAAMRENAGIQREGMQQAGATERTGMTEQGANARAEGRNAVERDEFGLKKEAAGFQTRAAKRQEKLYERYDAAKTPEERAGIAQQLRELNGKEASPSYKSHVLPNIKNADGSTTMGGVYQEDLRTGAGKWMQPPGDGQAPQAAPKSGEVRNGYRFKGGNPNDQANWAKV